MRIASQTTRHGASTDTLLQRFRRVRATTNAICQPLSAEDMIVQACPETSPSKWHLAHTTWFFETFILEAFEPGFKPYSRPFRVLFNSYYQTVGERHPRPERGMLTRPGLGEVLAYRDVTDERIADLLKDASDELCQRIDPLVELGLNHEQQHQELILMDIKRLLSLNPIEPAYAASDHDQTGPAPTDPSWVRFGGGISEIGAPLRGRFVYDNETPRHRSFVGTFELRSRLVTNAEYAEFIEAGGYDDPSLWLDPGWTMRTQEKWESPLYWRRISDGTWSEYTLFGRRPIDPDAPAVHLSFYEADAFAKWSGARLPTESEWESAAAPSWPKAVASGNFLEDHALRPLPAQASAGGPQNRLRQLAGDVWEWTRSAHEPYPGYTTPRGAIGEYNGKFMCGSFVLRGGSCVTPRDHIRPTYRNFFRPGARWAFSGIRLARDARHSSPARSTLTESCRCANLRPTVFGAADEGGFEQDAVDGLSRPEGEKSIPPRHLYDAIGGRLFEQITQLEEYYLTRTENRIIEHSMPDIRRALGSDVVLIEPGSGDGSKAAALLDALDAPRMYVPIEVNQTALARSSAALARRFPDVQIQPIRAAFREGLESLYDVPGSGRVVFFPGSSIGNLNRPERIELLRSFVETIGPGGRVLLGFDLVKDPKRLCAAYDDAQGISAAFGMNIITRLNGELGAGLDPAAFKYGAVWNEEESRIEMGLTSAKTQRARLGGREIVIEAGERLLTEFSHKFTQESILEEADEAGLYAQKHWSDPSRWFAVYLFKGKASSENG